MAEEKKVLSQNVSLEAAVHARKVNNVQVVFFLVSLHHPCKGI
jgi:hypothetical protein